MDVMNIIPENCTPIFHNVGNISNKKKHEISGGHHFCKTEILIDFVLVVLKLFQKFTLVTVHIAICVLLF